MLNNKIHLSGLILTVSFSCLSSSIFAAPLQILEFKKGQLSQVEQTQICEQLKDLCQQQAQWRSLKTVDQNLWLLSGSDIAQFHVSQTGLKLTHQWRIQLVPSEETARTTQYVFPKLFPMDQNRYAVAVIDTVSEMYSGGGAGIERASFYELKDSGNTHRFIENYPFSFNRMIRACFRTRL